MALGTLAWTPAVDRTDLLADPVARALGVWAQARHEVAEEVLVAEIDPTLADTAAMSEAYGLPLDVSANCVVVGGRRAGDERVAACVVLATTRADVNNAVRRLLDVRKASFLPMDDAVTRTGMEYGGITPVGLPDGWRVLVDARVASSGRVVVGSGVRRSKVSLPGELLAQVPGAEVVEGLALELPT